MKRDMLDAADQLRSQLGIFYWTIQHGGEIRVAAQQLQLVVRLTEQETMPWCLVVPQTLFARWSLLQLTLLLREARHILQRVDCDLPTHELPRLVHVETGDGEAEDQQTFLYGPLT